MPSELACINHKVLQDGNNILKRQMRESWKCSNFETTNARNSQCISLHETTGQTALFFPTAKFIHLATDVRWKEKQINYLHWPLQGHYKECSCIPAPKKKRYCGERPKRNDVGTFQEMMSHVVATTMYIWEARIKVAEATLIQTKSRPERTGSLHLSNTHRTQMETNRSFCDKKMGSGGLSYKCNKGRFTSYCEKLRSHQTCVKELLQLTIFFLVPIHKRYCTAARRAETT